MGLPTLIGPLRRELIMIAAAEGKSVFERLLRVFEASMKLGRPVVVLSTRRTPATAA